jgi:hypothetical protein
LIFLDESNNIFKTQTFREHMLKEEGKEQPARKEVEVRALTAEVIDFTKPLLLLLLWETQTETQDSEARKRCFSVPAQPQWTCVQRLSPENKGDSLYILL